MALKWDMHSIGFFNKFLNYQNRQLHLIPLITFILMHDAVNLAISVYSLETATHILFYKILIRKICKTIV